MPWPCRFFKHWKVIKFNSNAKCSQSKKKKLAFYIQTNIREVIAAQKDLHLNVSWPRKGLSRSRKDPGGAGSARPKQLCEFFTFLCEQRTDGWDKGARYLRYNLLLLLTKFAKKWRTYKFTRQLIVSKCL